VAAASGSAPGRQPSTAHVQTRIARCKTLLHMQQKAVEQFSMRSHAVSENTVQSAAWRNNRPCCE
jgi:hypothetical protein